MGGLRERVERALRDERQIEALWGNLTRMKKKRDEAFRSVGEETLERLKKARMKAERDPVGLLEALRRSMEERGGRLFVARNSEEAVNYVAELAASRGVRLVIKSKSLTSEEIELNRGLESRGVVVVETDTGERIAQLAGQRPSHILAPIVHMDRWMIADVISRAEGVEVEPDPSAITSIMRRTLRRSFLEAEMGVTGANVIVAETGTVMIVTNEGNGRLVSSLPKILVTVAGIEKIVESWDDAIAVIRPLTVSATGRGMPVYASAFGPGWRGVAGGESSEFHLVVIDNGRVGASREPWLREALRCIRCSACFNVCPTYRMVGGHIFGDIYTGPIGVLWTAITRGMEKAAEISALCVSCSLCWDSCPLSIDIPMSISWIKERAGGKSRIDRALSLYELYAKVGSRLPWLFNRLGSSSSARSLLEFLAGIDRRRPLPAFRGGSFFRVYNKMRREKGRGSRDLRVVYFVDTYAAYIDWRLAEEMVALSEHLGVDVEVPKQQGSGMPYIQYGFLRKAVKVAERNVESLAGYVRDGYMVVCTEPTAAYCLKHAYPRLLGSPESQLVSENTFEFCHFIYIHGLVDKLGRARRGRRVFYHYPCHAREASPGAPAARILERIGHAVTLHDYGCCGMAGTWGMRRGAEGYDISIEIGKRVCRIIRSYEPEMIATESSVCKLQLEQLSGLEAIHPVSLMLESVGSHG